MDIFSVQIIESKTEMFLLFSLKIIFVKIAKHSLFVERMSVLNFKASKVSELSASKWQITKYRQ